MSDDECKKSLAVAALGRPFQLGTLYDCRRDKLIPQVTLWNESTLIKKNVIPMKQNDFQVLRSDSINTKAKALEMNPSLKLTYLSGSLEDVKGAARYLYYVNKSNDIEHITLQYKCITRTESIDMKLLCAEKIDHSQEAYQDKATHVVTNILYGAQAFFIFEKRISSTDSQESSIQALIKKIPELILNKDQIKLTDEEYAQSLDLKCKYIGDFQLEENLSTFSEILNILKQLPHLLGTHGEKTNPLKIILNPLSLIEPQFTRISKPISTSIINEIEMFFEEMGELCMKCENIQNYNELSIFVPIRYQIEAFITYIHRHIIDVQDRLRSLIPRMKGGIEEERSLVDFLNKLCDPPFSSKDLCLWLQEKETQIKALIQHISTMSGIKFAKTHQEFQSIIKNSPFQHSLCLVISIPSNDSQLLEMERHLQPSSNNTLKQQYQSYLCRHQYGNKIPIETVIAAFKNFYYVNKNEKHISFLITQEFSEYDDFFARVELYESNNSKVIHSNYELPGCVENVELVMDRTTHNSVTITWSPPKQGASTILSYTVNWSDDETDISADENKFTITKLKPNTEYEVQVWAKCDVGHGPVHDTKILVKTKPTSQPKMVKTTFVSPSKVSLTWNAPTTVATGCCIEQYVIKQKHVDTWEEILRTDSKEFSCSVENLSNDLTKFKIATFCGKDGFGCDSEVCIVDLAKYNACEIIKKKICTNSDKIKNKPHIYAPKLRRIFSNDKNNIEKYEFGQRNYVSQEKVVMLLGATGSGKTTLINGLVNYIFGVDWKDPFRFKMILEAEEGDQSKSQTTKITSYIIHQQEGLNIPYTLNIIDTPGFGDVKGIGRDEEISRNIHRFFTNKDNGINNIDGIGFVVNSSLPRLTAIQKYIFDQVLSLFGKDISDNIFLLLTFADGKQPQVLSGIRKANIPYKKMFKFNNSALYAMQNDDNINNDTDNYEEDIEFDHMFWKMGVKSFEEFLNAITTVETKSLCQTKEVMRERETLQITIGGLQTEIQRGLITLERLTNEINVLENHDSDIEKNKDYEYEVDEVIMKQVNTKVGHYVTNCLKCNRTCHEDCKIPEDRQKFRCVVMKDGQYCTVCPDNCVWDKHVNNPYMYVKKINRVKRTLKDLKKRYEVATKQKLSTEGLINEIKGDFESLLVNILGMTHKVRKSIERLDEIALRRNPMSTVGYVEILMKAEESNAEPGWQARLKQLELVKKEAEYMEQISKDGFDPFKQYIQVISRKETKSKFFSKSLEDIKKKYYGYMPWNSK